jgi:hypothetical protein
MQLRYDEDFIETAVFRCASGPKNGMPMLVPPGTKICSPHPLQIARFHREREKLYAILDPDERNTAFFKLHFDWFREWGLDKPLTELLTEFPLLSKALSVLAVRQTRGKNDEGAELYVNEAGERSAILALRPEQLAGDGSADFSPLHRGKAEAARINPESWNAAAVKRAEARAPIALRDYLRHEFTHLHDMLNPAFGYSPVLDLPGLNAAQQRIARERYRLLWDITIDGRLTAAGHTPIGTHAQHFAAFACGYSFWVEQKQAETFDSLWHNAAPRHADLLALITDPRGLRHSRRPMPGASCPLCDFPTFTWADAQTLSPESLRRVTAEFPSWTPEQGLCGRCLEAYGVAASLQPAAR